MGVHIVRTLQEAAQAELDNGVRSRLIQEAASTADFPALMANTLYKIMLKGYTEFPTTWKSIVSDTSNLKDFKEQMRTRFSESDNLLEVGEHGEYKDSSLIDEKVRFAPKKFGRIFGVSWEALINDDMQEIKKQPQRFGKSAARTLDYDVWSYIRNNPTIYDGNSLFDSSNHNNDGTNLSLNEANLVTAYNKIIGQTDLKGYKIRMVPKILACAPGKEIQVWKLLNTVQGALPTSGVATDPLSGATIAYSPTSRNFFQGRLTPIFVPWFDAEEWYLIADPAQYDTVEVGFLNGKQDPDLFVQDGQQGQAFERDEIRYKVRLVWGKVVLDYRPFYRGYAMS